MHDRVERVAAARSAEQQVDDLAVVGELGDDDPRAAPAGAVDRQHVVAGVLQGGDRRGAELAARAGDRDLHGGAYSGGVGGFFGVVVRGLAWPASRGGGPGRRVLAVAVDFTVAGGFRAVAGFGGFSGCIGLRRRGLGPARCGLRGRGLAAVSVTVLVTAVLVAAGLGRSAARALRRARSLATRLRRERDRRGRRAEPSSGSASPARRRSIGSSSTTSTASTAAPATRPAASSPSRFGRVRRAGSSPVTTAGTRRARWRHPRRSRRRRAA